MSSGHVAIQPRNPNLQLHPFMCSRQHGYCHTYARKVRIHYRAYVIRCALVGCCERPDSHTHTWHYGLIEWFAFLASEGTQVPSDLRGDPRIRGCFVSPVTSVDVMDGNGTIALEIIDQLATAGEAAVGVYYLS